MPVRWVLVLASCASCLADNPSWDGTPAQGTTVATGSASDVDATAPSSTDPSTDPSTGAPEDTESIVDDPYAAAVVGDHPLAYWRLGDSDPPVAANEIGPETGTYRGGVLPGEPGLVIGSDTAARFPGSPSEHIRVDTGFDFAGRAPFSVEVWIQQDAAVDGCVLGKAMQDGDLYVGWFVTLGGEFIRFDRRPGPFAEAPRPDTTGPVHVVCTYDGTNSIIYVDGERVATRINETDIPAHEVPLLIGGCTEGAWAGFEGVLDEVALYDVPLSAAQVVAHHRAGVGL
jgi:hypothetical protein